MLEPVFWEYNAYFSILWLVYEIAKRDFRKLEEHLKMVRVRDYFNKGPQKLWVNIPDSRTKHLIGNFKIEENQKKSIKPHSQPRN